MRTSCKIFLFLTIPLLLGSITGIVISSIVINNHMETYTKQNCSLLTETSIDNIYGDHYKCSGYSTFNNNNKALLVYPPFDSIITKVSKGECERWIERYSNDTLYNCYIDNVNRTCTTGYIIKSSISSSIIIVSVLSVFTLILLTSYILICVYKKRSESTL
jgi:hypothetical protein